MDEFAAIQMKVRRSHSETKPVDAIPSTLE
jgi:hypothetical protein